MSKINIAILSAIAVLLSGCGSGQPKTPVKDEQTKGVYKIYRPNYFKYDAKMQNALFDAWCENGACKQAYKNKTGEVTYLHITSGNKCKFLDSVLKNDEAAEISKLEQQKARDCMFINDKLMHDIYYKSGAALVDFQRNKNGDFINSEFLTLQDGKVVDRKFIENTETIMFYDKNGNKLLDKAYQNIYFYPQTCDKALAVDGLKYKTLRIAAQVKNVKPQIINIPIDKNVEKLLKTKFYLDNKNSSIIKIFAPFGYMIEYGESFIGSEHSKRKIKIYRFFDENGNDVFENMDLTSAIKINDNRFYAQTANQINDKEYNVTTFLYDTKNKKVLFETSYMKPDNVLGIPQKYDLLAVIKNGESGLIDFDGNIVIDYQDKYNIVTVYKGIAAAEYYDKNKRQTMLLDLKLNPIIKDARWVDFQDNFIIVHFTKSRIVVFDYSKKMLYDLKADSINFYDKFFITTLKNESTLYGYDGNKLLDKTYTNLTNIDNELLSYRINGKTALMDINAKKIIPPVCDSIKQGFCETIECVNF
ncbi:MAG: hypothetical protein LBB59_02340 [Campylobacteraceae bacterium]|jgi:PBP1b-binding outer membrane lipoprotein LpoB|nr:hypothetical protein [Campylobacteraceae bacterium]